MMPRKVMEFKCRIAIDIDDSSPTKDKPWVISFHLIVGAFILVSFIKFRQAVADEEPPGPAIFGTASVIVLLVSWAGLWQIHRSWHFS